MTGQLRRSWRSWTAFAGGLAVVVVLGLLSAPAATSATDVGYVGPTYNGASAPTGEKPQSKLWFNDGSWWGSLFDEATKDFTIWRLDSATQNWVNTRTVVDTRAAAFMDTLWDGTHLWVATAGPTAGKASHNPRVARFTYDPATRTYSLESGFPVSIGPGGVEAVVLDEDSTGTVWSTYTRDDAVWVAHSTTSPRTWTRPFQLPSTGGETTITPDDISAVVAYDGNKIGVMWSNQSDGTMYWATHLDGHPDTEWSIVPAYRQPEGSDDHINLKGLVSDDAGRVFGAVKTSFNSPQDPLIHLLVLRNNGEWTSHVFGTVSQEHTRALVMLDPQARRLYMFASAPCCTGGIVYYKETSIDAISFSPGLGTPFISSDAHAHLNNPTSTKQAVTQATGLVVLAGDDRTHTYMHNVLALPSPTPAPAVTSTSPTSGATSVPVGVAVTATFSNAMAASSVTTATVTLAESATPAQGVSASVAYDVDSRTVTLRPAAVLSPATSYTATVAGGAAGVRDTGGFTMTADKTWSFTTASTGQPPTVVFSDDFSSGDFTRWSVVKTGVDGTAAVVAGRAELASTRTAGAFAYARKDLTTGLGDSVLSFDGVTVAQGSSGATVTLSKLYSPAGTRFLTLSRVNGTGLLRVDLSGAVTTTAQVVPLGTQVHMDVHVVAGDTPQVTVELDGVPVFTSTAAAVPAAGLGRVLIGTDNVAQAFRQTYDNIRIFTP